jgi:DNA-binding CsgD family transcriptional regulator
VGASDRLNAQEATIARMLVEGMAERQVAAELFIGAVALRAHLARICAKLDIGSPGDLVTVIGHGTALDFDPRQGDRAAESCARPPAARVWLTSQEDAVHRLLHDGLDERQVAAELFIGIGAVRSHVAHIQEKLGVQGPFRR